MIEKSASIAQMTFSRRTLLASAPGVLFALTGCQSAAAPKAVPSYAISDLFSTKPYYIAHRGSGDNWTEHTALAYASSVKAGAKAIEVSVHSTKDGVLVCHHDKNLLRMTGHDINIASVSYKALSAIMNNARAWLGPATALEPIPKLKDVLDLYAATRVMFLEDKDGNNTKVMLDLMDTYPTSKTHIVWKQAAAATSYKEARARGYKIWGYFNDNAGQQFSRYASQFDYLGIYHLASDADISALVAYRKPVICWEVHTRWMRDRLLALGVQGLMCSNFPYVKINTPIATHDSFATGKRAAGDLPALLQWNYQPAFATADAALSLNNGLVQGYCMGSLCPVQGDNVTLTFKVRWNITPNSGHVAAVNFAQSNDNPSGSGYRLRLKGNGKLELHRIGYSAAGKLISDTLLVTIKTPVPVRGAWIPLSVTTSATTIYFERQDAANATGQSSDTQYRGGYFSILKDYKGKDAVEFAAISAAP